MQLRDYQINLSIEANEILKKYNIVMLAMEVRTGKTLTSLEIAKLYGAKKVLFLTKLKAIPSIWDDYTNGGYKFDINILNYESLHKVEGQYDLLILDESHKLGTFPKPNNKVKLIKEKFFNIPKILLSGTPSPESYSQYYHQFFLINKGPFAGYINFYKWARDGFVKIIQKDINGLKINDYTQANYVKIMDTIGHLILTYTQKKAGFISNIIEKILYVDMKPVTYKLINILKKKRIIESEYGIILGDTAAKRMNKIHQLSSGTIKFEDGSFKVFDTTKAKFILDTFKDKKIAIFYKFQAEYILLKEVFGDNLTNNLQIFNDTNKNIALQIVSGREGISLKKADCLIFFNIDFSATSYFQARDRLTTKERENNIIYWVFCKGGIEDQIYEAVSHKKNFTSRLYNNYEREKYTNKNN